MPSVKEYLSSYGQDDGVAKMHRHLRQAPVDKLIERSIDVITEDAIRRNTFQGAHPRTPLERARDGEFDKDSDDSQYGDALFNRIVECMGEFGEGSDKIELRVDQRIMFSHCMGALLPLIYGDKLEANRKRLLASLGLDRISQEVIVLASRRVGKTYFVAMLLASLLICVPEIEIVIFSKSLRQSAKAAQLVVKFVKMHPQGRGMFVRSNQELVELQGDAAWKTKKLHSFPDRVDDRMNGIELRGKSHAHRLFCMLEESRCNPGQVSEGENWLFIAISRSHSMEQGLGPLAIILAGIPASKFQLIRLSLDTSNDSLLRNYTKTLAKHLSMLVAHTQKHQASVRVDIENLCVQIADQEPSATKTIYIFKENLGYFNT